MRTSVCGPAVLTLAGAILLLFTPAGCRGQRDETMSTTGSSPDSRTYLLETVGDFAVARIYADGFEDLTPRERVLAYYLFKAALAGRDIYYDQMGRNGLEIRDLLEEILTHSQGLPKGTVTSIHEYLKLFWINNGNHFDRTKRKFVPGFSHEQLLMAAQHARRNGAGIRLALGETLEKKLARLDRTIFDEDYEPLLTCKNPPPGQDILTCSSVNYYEAVTLAEAESFDDRYPLNSRLVRQGDGLVEEVYRAGRGSIPAGRYSGELKKAIGYIEKARPYAGESQREVLGLLRDFFATGDPEEFRRFNIAWVRDEVRVDTINGFIETYKDPRSRKGAFEGMVHFVDPVMTRLQKDLARQAQYFEDRTPWEERFKRRGIDTTVANAVNLLVAVGDSGPMPPLGVNLPNEQEIRERYGTKSVTLVNVMEAGMRATQAKLVEEFVAPEDRPLMEKYASEVGMLQTTMHEILGHASGKVSSDLRGDPPEHLREYYSTLEEARAELVALHHFFDPQLVEIGAVSSNEVAEAAYLDYLVSDLFLLRRVMQGDSLQDDHMRATHLIVGYLREFEGAVRVVQVDGKTYIRVGDIDAMRRGVARLLAEIQRIKGEGDYEAGRDLVQRFGIRIDETLRDEIVARARGINVPSYVAFVMPDIIPVRDASDQVVDARVEYRSDLTVQMLQYSGKLPLE